MPKKILVVDDYQDVRTLLVRSLAARDYEIVAASSGAEAVEKALSEKFDIIIMDLGLPGMTGIDTTEELKKIQPPLTSRSLVTSDRRVPGRRPRRGKGAG